MSDLQSKIAALPEWPKLERTGSYEEEIIYNEDRLRAALARLALAREWIELHGERFTSGGRRTGRDALLKALEVPRD